MVGSAPAAAVTVPLVIDIWPTGMVCGAVSTVPPTVVNGLALIVADQVPPVPRASVMLHGAAAVAVMVLLAPVSAVLLNANDWVVMYRQPLRPGGLSWYRSLISGVASARWYARPSARRPLKPLRSEPPQRIRPTWKLPVAPQVVVCEVDESRAPLTYR